MKKSWIAAGCALTGLVLAYSAVQTQDKKQPSKEPVVPVKIDNRHSLEITFQPYTLLKNQKDGERDLIQLAKDASYEGAWIFKPNTSEWHHVSISHEEVNSEGKIAFGTFFDMGLMVKFGSPSVFYHIHPDVFRSEANKTVRENIFGKDNETDTEIKRRNKEIVADLCATAYMCFPSKEDCGVFVEAQKILGEGFESRIVTSTGVTKIKILDASQETIDAYSAIYKDLFVKIIQYGLVLKEGERGPVLDYQETNVVNELNKELEGRLKLEITSARDF